MKLHHIAPLNDKLQILFLSGDSDLIKRKLAKSPMLLNWKDSNKANLLHYLALSGNVTAIEYVFQNHPELNQSFIGIFETDKKGRNLLHYAAWSGDIETIEYIKNKFPDLLHKKDNYGRTWLHYIIMSKNLVAIQHYFKNPYLLNLAEMKLRQLN